MSQQPTLNSIFEATKSRLAASLEGLALPKDAAKVQEVITTYLNEVCDADNEYRQNLTQSEDYILQAALAMLNAQRELVVTLDTTPKITVKTPATPAAEEAPGAAPARPKSPLFSSTLSSTDAFIGSAGGALVGKLILGGWGAVFGALAGTAVVLYIASQKPSKPAAPARQLSTQKPEVVIADTPLNVDALLDVIGRICLSLDNLIVTFRAQIQRVVQKYESQEKPTIERDYRTLLEGIQSLIGYKRGHSPEEEKYLSKLQTRIEDMAELLDNYDLEAVDYTPDKAAWFEAVESKNATEIKLVTPAIVKEGTLVLKGKIFVPAE